MKICCICLRKADGDEPTCVACGEASWAITEAVAAPVVEETSGVVEDTEEAPAKKRARR